MADSKLTALSEVSVPTLDDLLYWVDDPAGTPASDKCSATRAFGILNQICQGRLTLSSVNPIYAPSNAAIPASTDTTAETVTFTNAHGWTNGTVVTVSTTVGGLTQGTIYYVNAASTTAVSFHTTVADALAGTSKVNLTASITGYVIPIGVANTTLYFTPFRGNCIAVYDGTRWRMYTFSELSVALGTLTAALPYDVFVYDNAGTLTLELLAWTSGTARATALVLQDGVWCKSGALTRRYLGTIYTTSTTTTEDSSRKRDVWNAYNRVSMPLWVAEWTASWTYGTVAWQQARASAVNQIECVVGLPWGSEIELTVIATVANNTLGGAIYPAIGRDSTTVPIWTFVNCQDANVTGSVMANGAMARIKERIPLGYHYYAWLEANTTTNAATISSYNTLAAPVIRMAGMNGGVEC